LSGFTVDTPAGAFDPEAVLNAFLTLGMSPDEAEALIEQISSGYGAQIVGEDKKDLRPLAALLLDSGLQIVDTSWPVE